MEKFLIYAISGGVFGLLAGLVPLFFGIRKNQRDMGIIALIICGISGILFGLILAVPIAILFTFIIYAKTKGKIVCPYCKEYINKDASICKHCKQSLEKINS